MESGAKQRRGFQEPKGSHEAQMACSRFDRVTNQRGDQKSYKCQALHSILRIVLNVGNTREVHVSKKVNGRKRVNRKKKRTSSRHY